MHDGASSRGASLVFSAILGAKRCQSSPPAISESKTIAPISTCSLSLFALQVVRVFDARLNRMKPTVACSHIRCKPLRAGRASYLRRKPA